jgi:SAM-dependent methyltransferase
MAVEDLVVCGVCQGELRELAAGPSCERCNRAYRRRAGVPDLTPIPPPDETMRSKWSLWEELQANGELSYRDEPEASLSVGDRDDVARFGVFCELSGLVLDVGCGPQALPAYSGGERFVGIDPLRGEDERQFDFVQGLGEYLPFRPRTFDHVIYATSLDHLIDPIRALREAARVLKPHGTIEIWSGEAPAPLTPLPSAAHALHLLRHADLREFARNVRHRLGRRTASQAAPLASAYRIPDGAADAFHLFESTKDHVDETISQAGLTIVQTGTAPPWQRFLRVAPASR